MNEKIGEQLIRLDLLSFEQAEEILRIQKSTSPLKRFGDIALELGYITQATLEDNIKDKV